MKAGTDRVIIIRANGSVALGSGHIRRMCILARYMREFSLSPVLLCNTGALEVFPPAREAFEMVHEIKGEGYPAEANATAQIRALYGDKISAVFFDHYNLGAEEHRLYRAAAPYIAAIDDMANRKLDADIVFDINLGRSAKDYRNLLPPHAKVHTGQDFQIINPAFYDLQSTAKARREYMNGRIERVFIALGGTDPLGFTPRLLNTAANLLPNACFDTVSGSLNPTLPELKALATRLGPRVRLHVDTDQVPELMAKADLALGAGGTMTWERNSLGLASLLLIIADNQIQVGRAMADSSAAIVIDARDGYDDRAVSSRLSALIADPEKRAQLSRHAEHLSGVNGAENMVRILIDDMSQLQAGKQEIPQ